MKLALIPPLCRLRDMEQTDYQLILPQLVNSHVRYEDFVYHLKTRGDFLILDNGAAEGKIVEEDDLIDIAVELEVNELAVPDTLGDMVATLKQFIGFFERNEETLAVNKFSTGGPNLGFVAQGNSWVESISLVNTVMKSDWSPYINTVYIPRLLVKESGNVRERIQVAEQIYKDYAGRLEIHMFGSAPEWPREAMAVDTECPYVRGMDTSMPYNFAYQEPRRPAQAMGGGASIWDATGSKPLIRRPEGYFTKSLDRFDLPLLEQNVRVMHTWTGSIPMQSAKSAL